MITDKHKMAQMPISEVLGYLVEYSIRVLRENEPEEGYYLCFSGGKDSQLIYHLAKEAGVKFDAHYSVTTIDPPEVTRFIKKAYPDVIWHHPKRSFAKECVRKGILPTRSRRWCCQIFKEYGGDGRVVVLGIRSGESSKRSRREEKTSTKKKTTLSPILHWPEFAVWEYLEMSGIESCSLYDEPGIDRIGCVLCPVSSVKKRQHEMKRWPQYKKLFIKVCRDIKASGKGDQSQSPEELFDWWISW